LQPDHNTNPINFNKKTITFHITLTDIQYKYLDYFKFIYQISEITLDGTAAATST